MSEITTQITTVAEMRAEMRAKGFSTTYRVTLFGSGGAIAGLRTTRSEVTLMLQGLDRMEIAQFKAQVVIDDYESMAADESPFRTIWIDGYQS